MSVGFVHLHLHTEFSLSDGLCRIKPLAADCKAKGLPAVAMTDLNNLFAMVKFYRAAMANGIKPIFGMEVDIAAPQDDALKRTTVPNASALRSHRLVLLCRTHEGYLNLSRLVSRAYLEGQHSGAPLIERDWMTAQGCEGLIALSAAAEGDIGEALMAGKVAEAQRCLEHWQGVFGERE